MLEQMSFVGTLIAGAAAGISVTLILLKTIVTGALNAFELRLFEKMDLRYALKTSMEELVRRVVNLEESR